jgi:hypothetical protein
MLESPENRKRLIDDVLKKKGLYVANGQPVLTPAQQCLQRARVIWKQIFEYRAKPILKALPTPSAYQPAATQELLCGSFMTEFRSWSKDDLVFLVSCMHCEEMEKVMQEAVNAGCCGEHMDKPI